MKHIVTISMIAVLLGSFTWSWAQYHLYWPGPELGDLVLDIDKEIEFLRLWYPADDIFAVTVRDTNSAYSGIYIFYYDRKMLLQKAIYQPSTSHQARQLLYQLREECYTIGPLHWECYVSSSQARYTFRYEIALLPLEEDKMVFYYFRDRHLHKKF